jgi:aryl-alcohol dehydrogenase-like predicted oxidoreductase
VTAPSPFRRLGHSGLTVSVVGLGTNNFGMKLDLEQSRAVVHAALDNGVTLIDTADSYGESETRLGEILAAAGPGVRDDIVIATKFGSDVRRLGQDNGADWGARGSRRYIKRAVVNSLRRLQTDWIDLYQMHRPDPLTPIEETLSALDDLVHEGKVRYIGHSNFRGWQAAEAEWVARSSQGSRFISAQNEYSLLKRGIEADLVPALVQYGVGLLPFFPLASGLLTGKYRRGEAAPEGSRVKAWNMESALNDQTFDVLEQLEAFAASRSVTLLEVAIGGLAGQPAVASVIAGATSPEQVVANVKAGEWRPSVEDLAELDRIISGDGSS